MLLSLISCFYLSGKAQQSDQRETLKERWRAKQVNQNVTSPKIKPGTTGRLRILSLPTAKIGNPARPCIPTRKKKIEKHVGFRMRNLDKMATEEDRKSVV